MEPPQYVIVSNAAIAALVEFVAQASLPMGRDKLVQDVIDSARPVEEPEETE